MYLSGVNILTIQPYNKMCGKKRRTQKQKLFTKRKKSSSL